MKNTHLWGIDLGGTKIEGVVLKSRDNPQVVIRQRIATEGENGYRHILNRIKILVDKLKAEVGQVPDHIGFATPGTFDSKMGVMKNCNSIALNGQNLIYDLKEILNCNVSTANDANCFALAETRMGVVKDNYPNSKVVFGVIMGTGVGGGIVVNNESVRGLQGIAGEWGHNFLSELGGVCYCGRLGCVETLLSGSGLERYYFGLTGQKKSLKEIYALSKSGDVSAKQTIDRLIEFFGKGLSVVINILDPDVIVLGGGVSNIEELYTDGIESVKKYVFNTRLDTPIVKPKLGDSAGVFGAAFLTTN